MKINPPPAVQRLVNGTRMQTAADGQPLTAREVHWLAVRAAGALTVADRARDAADAGQLLAALGLDREEEPDPLSGQPLRQNEFSARPRAASAKDAGRLHTGYRDADNGYLPGTLGPRR